MRSGHRHADVFGDFVVTMNASGLFDEIDLACQVAPPSRVRVE